MKTGYLLVVNLSDYLNVLKIMMHNPFQYVRSWLMTGLIIGASLTLWNCSGDKKETTTESTSTEAASDSSVFGRQGDTTTNTLDAPQQAPVSGEPGTVVPAEVKVKPKK